VAVALAQLTDRQQRLDPLGAGLADPDQDPRRERHASLARRRDRLEPPRRQLVRRAEVRAPSQRKAIGGRLEHRPLRHAHLPQRSRVFHAQYPGVHVRQESRLLEDEARAPGEVLERRAASERRQLLPRDSVAPLRLVPEREERLVTPRSDPRPSHVEDLVLAQVRTLAAPRRLRERAVMADVAAELRQRDEDLGRVRHERAVALIPEPPPLGAELARRGVKELGGKPDRHRRDHTLR
jgi:hypothetical protein